MKKPHQSALDHKGDVLHYLSEECQFGAVLGPFNSHPIQNMHCCPFMTRPKPSSDHRLVIIDLSYPYAESINAGISPDTYLDSKFYLLYPLLIILPSKSKN